MRFALVIPELHKRGGTERCMVSLAEALERRGHHFTIFANRCDAGVLPAARRYRVPMARRPHIPRFFSFHWGQALIRWFAGLRGERYDLVLSTGPDVRRPSVTVFHCSAAEFAELATDSSQQSRSAVSRLKRWSSRISYRAIAGVERRVVRDGASVGVAISHALKRDFERHHGDPARRLKVIPDGVDLSDFYARGADVRARVRRDLQIDGAVPVVLFVGHNWLRKGLPVLIEAMRRLAVTDATLVIAGMGEPAFKREAEQALGARVRFLGTYTQMAELYSAADLLVLPTFREPFGLPVLEAMACNLPVIVSCGAGVAECITDGVDGLLLDDPADVRALAAQIERLLSDARLRERLGDAARRTAERFSWDEVAAQFEGLCNEAAGRRR